MFHWLRIVQLTGRWLLVTALAFLWSGVSFAQVTSGTIFGTVKDQSGAYVANATVTVKDALTGVVRSISSSEGGGFVVPNLPPGMDAITVEVTGFKKLEKTGIICLVSCEKTFVLVEPLWPVRPKGFSV
jgi:hypothetical protein